VNNHLLTLFVVDIKNAVATLLREIEPLLSPYLPARTPVGPQDITVMGGPVREVVMRVAPIWRGNTRVTIADDLIVVEARTSNGWVEAWRSDVPAVPQSARAPAPAPIPAPEATPEPPPEPQPGQLCANDSGFFFWAKGE
jgi:hypothetical protein